MTNPERIFIPIYRYGHPNFGALRRKYNTLIYSDIFIAGCFFLLELSKVCFQVRQHVLSIVNHSKDKNMCSLKGLCPIDTHQHFNMELLSALQSLQNHLCQKIMSKKPLCPKNPLVMPLIVILACCLKFPVDTKTLHQYIARIKQFFARFSLEIFNFFTE